MPQSINGAINEIIGGHKGPRTFISNAYKNVQDPKLIGKMSGHTDGNRAFERYRHIDDDTLRGSGGARPPHLERWKYTKRSDTSHESEKKRKICSTHLKIPDSAIQSPTGS